MPDAFIFARIEKRNDATLEAIFFSVYSVIERHALNEATLRARIDNLTQRGCDASTERKGLHELLAQRRAAYPEGGESLIADSDA